MKKVLFTCDLEDWFDGLHVPNDKYTAISASAHIVSRLNEYGIKAIFYVLGAFAERWPAHMEWIKREGHMLKTHGQFHYRHEEADRKPYSWLGFTGGFYFRALPYFFIRDQVLKNGLFYIHPHDVYEEHPVLSNPFMNWKRHVGLKGARKKLDRLLREIEWGNPWE